MTTGKPRPLPHWQHFAFKILRNAFLSATLILISLSAGAIGYHEFENLPWLDAYLNASMILTGMGPVGPLLTDGGKLFAIVYSLFSGVIFLSACAVLLAPLAHRFLHRFHLDMQDEEEARKPRR